MDNAFHIKPTRIILRGDKELAAGYVGNAKRMIFQLRNIQNSNKFIQSLDKRFEDGTTINVHSKVKGMDVIEINSSRYFEKEEKKYRETEITYIAPAMLLYTGEIQAQYDYELPIDSFVVYKNLESYKKILTAKNVDQTSTNAFDIYIGSRYESMMRDDFTVYGDAKFNTPSLKIKELPQTALRNYFYNYPFNPDRSGDLWFWYESESLKSYIEVWSDTFYDYDTYIDTDNGPLYFKYYQFTITLKSPDNEYKKTFDATGNHWGYLENGQTALISGKIDVYDAGIYNYKDEPVFFISYYTTQGLSFENEDWDINYPNLRMKHIFMHKDKVYEYDGEGNVMYDLCDLDFSDESTFNSWYNIQKEDGSFLLDSNGNKFVANGKARMVEVTEIITEEII